MLITVSRRTDIPAFYTPWFINRLRAGYCTVPNPFNARQISHIDLRPEAVDAFVFFSRSYRPLLPYLDEMDRRGYRAFYHATLVDYPKPLEPFAASMKLRLRSIVELSDRVSPDLVAWRYDPIVFSNLTPPDFHRRAFETITAALRGKVFLVVISLLDLYPKVSRRLDALRQQGLAVASPEDALQDFMRLAPDLAEIAARRGMEIEACAEAIDLAPLGIRKGHCVDGEYLARRFDWTGTQARPYVLDLSKDPGQRPACGCARARDIGSYNTCLFGCVYCYATDSFERSRQRYAAHDPDSPSLVGWVDAPPAL